MRGRFNMFYDIEEQFRTSFECGAFSLSFECSMLMSDYVSHHARDLKVLLAIYFSHFVQEVSIQWGKGKMEKEIKEFL